MKTRLLARGQGAWPDFEAGETCRTRLELLEKKNGGIVEPFAAEDFFLVAAFAQGIAPALGVLRTRLARCVGSVAAGLSASDRDEIEADLMVELFTSPGAPKEPGLLGFQGRGTLEAFFSVAVARKVVAHRNRQRRDLPAEDEVLLGAVAEADAGELAVLKQRYGKEISRCFEQAIAALPSASRLLLRQHYLDGLSIEAVASSQQVHRATAARWLADARVELLDQVRTQVSGLLGIARIEVDSLVRAIDSRLDLSARFFLSRRE